MPTNDGGRITSKRTSGTQSSYSGEGYFYVARFAQNKAGKPFDQLAQDYVFGPLGMKDTSFTATLQCHLISAPANPTTITCGMTIVHTALPLP